MHIFRKCFIVFAVTFLFSCSPVALTWNVEDLIPPTERYIFNFNSKEELKKWHLYSDSEYGGMHMFNFIETPQSSAHHGITLMLYLSALCISFSPIMHRITLLNKSNLLTNLQNTTSSVLHPRVNYFYVVINGLLMIFSDWLYFRFILRVFGDYRCGKWIKW